MGDTGIIVTGVDKLVKLLREQGEMSIARAAKSLGVSQKTVEEWVSFLEEENIVALTYKFTTPYISLKRVSESQVSKKTTKLEANKDIFVRKAESMLSFLDKEGEELNRIREEFASLKDSIGVNFDHVKDEIKELENYEKAKRDVDVKVDAQRREILKRIQETDAEIARQQKKYMAIIKEVEEEERRIEKDQKSVQDMEKIDAQMRARVAEFKSVIRDMEAKISQSESGAAASQKHIEQLKQLAAATHKKMEEEKEQLLAMISQSKQLEEKVMESQQKILKGLASKVKNSRDLKEAVGNFKRFFKKKGDIEKLIAKINADRNELEKDLYEIIKKVKSVQLIRNASETDSEIKKFAGLFGLIDKKKAAFEGEIHQLGKILKKW